MGSINSERDAMGMKKWAAKAVGTNSASEVFLSPLKIDETFGYFHRDQTHLDFVADVAAVCSLNNPALGGEFQKPHISTLRGSAGNNALEDLANALLEQAGGGDFAHQPFDFAGCIFPLGAVSGNLGQLGKRVGRHSASLRTRIAVHYPF